MQTYRGEGGNGPCPSDQGGPSWMELIVLFLKKDILSKDKSEANKLRRKAP